MFGEWEHFWPLCNLRERGTNTSSFSYCYHLVLVLTCTSLMISKVILHPKSDHKCLTQNSWVLWSESNLNLFSLGSSRNSRPHLSSRILRLNSSHTCCAKPSVVSLLDPSLPYSKIPSDLHLWRQKQFLCWMFVSVLLFQTGLYLLGDIVYDFCSHIQAPARCTGLVKEVVHLSCCALLYLRTYQWRTINQQHITLGCFGDSIIDDFFCNVSILVKMGCDVRKSYPPMMCFCGFQCHYSQPAHQPSISSLLLPDWSGSSEWQQ